MKTVYEYPLTSAPITTLQLPYDAKPLHVDVQLGDPRIQMWVETDSNPVSTVPRNFAIVPTGGEVPSHQPASFIGTVVNNELGLVFHIYEVH